MNHQPSIDRYLRYVSILPTQNTKQYAQNKAINIAIVIVPRTSRQV